MEKVYLVGAVFGGARKLAALDSLAELSRLAETAGGSVEGSTLQALDSPVPATLIGKGKMEELRALALKKTFTTLIFDEELKPAQQKNLADHIPAKILDRTRLILDIFARRARTREGILQVELAQLSYLLPRMTERYGQFEQQVGGIGTRGPGERKLEVEARHIRDRMAFLKKQIESVKLHRDVARERRHSIPMPTVALVGYTNAGKSTLLNTLVKLYGRPKEEVYADDKLFATLDPTTRRIRLPSGRWALFTDTVGFIRKLPHHLVAAFRSTLEETVDADLLIHVVDSADPSREEQARTVLDLLSSIEEEGGRLRGKMLIVYNKTDAVNAVDRAEIVRKGRHFLQAPDVVEEAGEPLYISASRGTGINQLLDAVDRELAERMVDADVRVPFKKMHMLPTLYRLGKVESVDHQSGGVRLKMKLEKSHWDRVQKMLKAGAAKK